MLCCCFFCLSFLFCLVCFFFLGNCLQLITFLHMDFSAEYLVSLSAEICNTLRYWKKPGYNSSCSWWWRLSSMATSFPGYSRRSCGARDELESTLGTRLTSMDLELSSLTVSLQQATQLILQLGCVQTGETTPNIGNPPVLGQQFCQSYF